MTITWHDTDQYRGLSKLVMAGFVGAALLALLGLPPVPHAPWHYIGVMDPLCGMTRAVQALAQFDPARAWRYNPASFVIAALGVAGLVRVAVGATTGRWLNLHLTTRAALIGAGTVAVAVLWIHQQLNADLLR